MVLIPWDTSLCILRYVNTMVSICIHHNIYMLIEIQRLHRSLKLDNPCGLDATIDHIDCRAVLHI